MGKRNLGNEVEKLKEKNSRLKEENLNLKKRLETAFSHLEYMEQIFTKLHRAIDLYPVQQTRYVPALSEAEDYLIRK